MTYRFTISDIEEVALSNFLTDDLHIDHYEDDILKSRSSSWKWNNMMLPLPHVIDNQRILVANEEDIQWKSILVPFRLYVYVRCQSVYRTDHK
ncbi:hypothetical protein T06_448 [Trichinella sp. T6]|nr:hypothetical protein T06_448 [Trichinella sp. T6]